MNIDFQIRHYQEEDVNSIIDLYALVFKKQIDKDWFHWKYRNAPWSSAGYIAQHHDRVIAFYGAIKLLFNFRGGTLQAYQVCDVMTHPEYRGRFFSKTPLIVSIGKLFYQENKLDFAFGFPTIRHARLQALRLDCIYRQVKQFEKEKMKEHKSLLKVSLQQFSEIRRDITFRSLITSNNSEISLIKSSEYLAWRYRGNTHNAFVFIRGENMIACIVFSLCEDYLQMLELFYIEEAKLIDVFISMETFIAKNLRDIRGVQVWFNPNEPAVKYLKYLGYKGRDSDPIGFTPVNTECGLNAEIFYEKYFYRMGDQDRL